MYELKLGSDHVMRRRSDDWINATHILKIAGYDKPARTRILEKEVQKGVHEKIQGGYGKYQGRDSHMLHLKPQLNDTGTWIPLGDGRNLAEKNGTLDRIIKIFDFVPGDRSPPPAPKHATAASNKAKTNRQPVPPRKPPVQSKYPRSQNRRALVDTDIPDNYYRHANEQYDADSVQYSEHLSREPSPERDSASFLEDDFLPASQNSTGSRKRKRDVEENVISAAELEHTIYGDELLDYFVTAGDDPQVSNILPPTPPPNFDVDRPIDSHGNNALHWACAMGDVRVARDLLSRGANPAAQNHGSRETPLIRAVLFTNNYDKRTFPKIVEALAGTIVERDFHGATVFHHIAETGRSRGKWSCARYYSEVLINKMSEMGSNYVQALLTSVDAHHDTAALCAIRNGCVKVATFLLNHCPEAGEIQNLKGETANDYLRALREKRESLEQPPSSPPGRSGDSFGSRRLRRKPFKQPVSRAASSMYDQLATTFEEQRDRLADTYDAEMKDKDTIIADAKQTLADFEAQRHKIRQEGYALMAKVEDDARMQILRHEYDVCLRETESLLEQKEHASLQKRVLQQDQLAPPQAFRSANGPPLSQDEVCAALPWAMELYRQQSTRRQLVGEIARLMGDAGTSEKIGKHRKLVAIATGIKEDELDHMSGELLESLQATQGGVVGVAGGPQTPPGMMAGLEVA